MPRESLPSVDNWLTVATDSAQNAELGVAGTDLLRQILAMPGLFWRQLESGAQPGGLRVLARPQDPLQSQPLPGDIILRIIEGGAGHVSLVASPGIVSLPDAGSRGLHVDNPGSQGYVHVVEPAPVVRRASEGFARGLTDSAGRVLEDLILLRLATQPTVLTAPQAASSPGIATTESLGDGGPKVSEAVDQCAHQVQTLASSLAANDNPSRVSRLDIARETHLSVDANPYAGLGRRQLEAVIRAAFTSHQKPQTLLALWAKEGSLRMVSSATAVAVATSAANARSLFRSNVYYVDLGSDHFVITRYDAGQKDNVWDNRDSAAAKHEAHFETRVRELVEAGVLAEDISSAINSELKVSAGAPFSVTPSIKFYSLSLLLMDALFTMMQRRTFSQLSTLGEALNYVQWNIGTDRFRKFLVSAEKHRKEKEFRTSGGDPIPIEQWALHTIPKKNEWRQPRTNAVRFMHYCDSYRPIFTNAMSLIQPVTESVRDSGARARQFSEMRLTRPSVEIARPLPEGSTCCYFFKNDRYLRYDIKGDVVDVAPAPISGSWHLPAEFQSNIDAAVNWGDGHVYFFKGAGYVRYNIATDLVDVGPVEISRFWTHLPKEFQANIGAAVNWGDGHAYFFKGAGYLRYNIETDLVDVGPTEISRFWKELPAEFQSDLDAVVNWGNGHAYFFKGNRYLRYDIPKKVVDVKPIEISANWNLPAEFQSNVRGVVNWTFPCNLAELLRAAGLTVNEVGDWHKRKRPGTFKPIGVMIHHTTPSNLNVLVHGDAKLPGPRCNFYIEKSGLVNVVSSGPANHAGRGAQVVLDEVKHGIAPTATALVRGFLDDPGGNSFFYGLENENRGDDVDPWPEVQKDAMARAAAALCQLHCWNENRVIGHKEWTRRKPVDPTLDMSDFRARVRSFF